MELSKNRSRVAGEARALPFPQALQHRSFNTTMSMRVVPIMHRASHFAAICSNHSSSTKYLTVSVRHHQICTTKRTLESRPEDTIPVSSSHAREESMDNLAEALFHEDVNKTPRMALQHGRKACQNCHPRYCYMLPCLVRLDQLPNKNTHTHTRRTLGDLN